MRFCINCGQQIPEGVRFCPKCGTKQIPQAPASTSEPKQEVQQSVKPQINQQSLQSQVSQQQYQTQAISEPKPQSQPQQAQPQMSQQPVQPQASQQYQQNFNQQQYSQSQNIYAGSGSQVNLGQPYHLNFSQSVKYIFDHMFEFNSDVQDNQKSIFWWNILVIGIFNSIVLSILAFISPVLSNLGYIASSVLVVASTMRRLNYLGKNRNLAWLILIPFVNLYPVVLMFTDKKV